MSQPAGDLVIDLSLDAARFDEQMARVRRHFSSLEADARKTASTVEQGLSRQALAAQKAGISVGQYKAAMRTLPAQFTDIVTQLAGGQNPFLIMLQQGGQISDSFGGPLSLLTLLKEELLGMRGYAEGGYVGGAGSPAQMRRAEGINFNQNNHVVIQNDGPNGRAGPQLMKAVYEMARKGAQDELRLQLRDGGMLSGSGG